MHFRIFCLLTAMLAGAEVLAATPFRTPSASSTISVSTNVYENETRKELPVTDAPWSAIGLVKAPNGQKCSGVLVARDIVLTAGHCLMDKEGHSIEGTYTFYAGYQRGTWRGQSEVKTKSFSRFAATVGEQDWALLRLVHPLGDTYSWFNVMYMNGTSLVAGAPNVYLLGYSADLGQMEIPFWQKDCSFREKIPYEEQVTHNCNMSPGSSGSPMVIWNAQLNNYYVVAINIAERRNGSTQSLIGVPFSSLVANVAVPSSQFFNILTAMLRDPNL